MNKIETNNNLFESIKHSDEYGNEYWEARELQKVLEYKEWRFSYEDYCSCSNLFCYSNKKTN